MTRTEFSEWLKHHRARFTGLSQWLGKLPTKAMAAEGEPSRADVLDAWYATLRYCDLDDCREASSRMAAGDIEEPRGYDRHPAAIRRAASGHAAERSRKAVIRRVIVDGEEAMKCLACRDTGIRDCWAPQSVQAAADNRLGESFTLYRAVAYCPCDAGKRYSQVIPAFDEGMHCELTGVIGNAEQQDNLLQWVEDHSGPQAYSEFEDFT